MQFIHSLECILILLQWQWPPKYTPTGKITSWQQPINGQLRNAVYKTTFFFFWKRSRNWISSTYRWLLVLFHLFILLVSLTYILQYTFLKNKNAATRKRTGVILHPYLPITITSLQRPLFSGQKVAILERFDCSTVQYIPEQYSYPLKHTVETFHTNSYLFATVN